MSDFQREPDWWQGADGYWYPPSTPQPAPMTSDRVADEPESFDMPPPRWSLTAPTVAARIRREWIIFGVMATALVGYLVLKDDGDSSSTPDRLETSDLDDALAAPQSTALPPEWERECPGFGRVMVTYSSSGQSGDYTAQTPTGTKQATYARPVSFCFAPGEFVYFSIQNSSDHGAISCKIAVDGTTISSNSSTGAYVIAQCDGSA